MTEPLKNFVAESVLQMVAPGGAWHGVGEEYLRERLREWIPRIQAQERTLVRLEAAYEAAEAMG